MEAHLWLRWNFSSQLKQKPCSRLETNSSGESLLIGKVEGGFEGFDSKDKGDGEKDEVDGKELEEEIGAGRLQKERRLSKNISS